MECLNILLGTFDVPFSTKILLYIDYAKTTMSKITFTRGELTVKWNKVDKQKFSNPIWFGAAVNIGGIPVISRANNIKLCMDWM